jgi:fused signal recognition particle receptor
MEFFKKLKDRLFKIDVSKQKEKSKNTFLKKQENLIIKKRKKTINKYVLGLKKSRTNFSRQILELQTKHNKINEEFFEELEEILIMSDISVSLVTNIIYEIKKEIKIENITSPKLISEVIIDKMFAIYTNDSIVNTNLNIENNRLNVILVVGVNGSGKTTTIAKLANNFINNNKKVLLAAADTFRAGAIEQLDI